MTKRKTGTYFSGTSGLVLPVKNKSFYPPEFQDSSRLSYYGSLFNSLEINSSFYKLPRLITLQKWTNSVPDGFRFTVKLWKEITHAKDLAFDPHAVKLFMDSIDISNEKKGCLLVQFPPGTKFSSFKQLQHLIATIKQYDADEIWKISIEFRDRSWYREHTYRLLEENKCALVIHDKTGSETPMDDNDDEHVYLRFHGPAGNYRGGYDDHVLQEYATYIKEWMDTGKDVYVYFNNTMGDAVKNLMTLNKYVTEETTA